MFFVSYLFNIYCTLCNYVFIDHEKIIIQQNTKYLNYDEETKHSKLDFKLNFFHKFQSK